MVLNQNRIYVVTHLTEWVPSFSLSLHRKLNYPLPANVLHVKQYDISNRRGNHTTKLQRKCVSKSTTVYHYPFISDKAVMDINRIITT